MSINQLSELTGKDRRTVKERCRELPYEDGPKGAWLYDVPIALEAIYVSGKGTLDQARTRLANSQADLSDKRSEELSKERIPIEIPTTMWDVATQAAAATLKAARGKVLDTAKINEILGKLRAIKLPIKW